MRLFIHEGEQVGLCQIKVGSTTGQVLLVGYWRPEMHSKYQLCNHF